MITQLQQLMLHWTVNSMSELCVCSCVIFRVLSVVFGCSLCLFLPLSLLCLCSLSQYNWYNCCWSMPIAVSLGISLVYFLFVLHSQLLSSFPYIRWLFVVSSHNDLSSPLSTDHSDHSVDFSSSCLLGCIILPSVFSSISSFFILASCLFVFVCCPHNCSTHWTLYSCLF